MSPTESLSRIMDAAHDGLLTQADVRLALVDHLATYAYGSITCAMLDACGGIAAKVAR